MRNINFFTVSFFLLFFLGIYFPYVGVRGFFFPSLLLAHIFPAFIYLSRLKLSVDDFCVVSYSIFLIIVISFLSLYKGGLDFRLLALATYLPFLYFSAKWLAIKSLSISHESVRLFIIFAFFCNALFIILLNIGVMDFNVFYSFVKVDPKVFSYPIVRYPGFSYDSFSYVSVLQAFGCCLVINQLLRRGSFYLVFCFFSLFISVVLSGRTGLLVVAMYLIYCCSLKDFKYISYCFSAVVFLIFLWMLDWNNYEWYKTWAFSFIIDFFSGEGVSDSSAVELKNHLFSPNNLLLGDDKTFLSVVSDLGFVRMYVAYGVLGVFLSLIFFWWFFLFSFFRGGKTPFFIVIVLCCLNFKDVYFVAPYGHFFLLFFILNRNNLVLKNDWI